MDAQTIRKPAVAGQFYPGDPEELREMTTRFIHESGVDAAPDTTKVIICPHAGFVYSGPTAGHGYARVKGKHPKRVILLGASHRENIETASVYTEGAFESPLGTFPIDEAFAGALAAKTESKDVHPHLFEHSLEVQLPFLAALFGEVPIVPVLFGGVTREWHARVGKALAEMTDPSDLLVASTDLSHYLDEDTAIGIDRRSIDGVLSQDWRTYVQGIATGRFSMCGATAVTAAITYAKAIGALSWQLLDYRTSAQASGDRRRVVGYAAISMESGE